MARGLFITFEGTEGCGKSTQVERLKGRLDAAGIPILVTREPGGTAIGECIRELLQFSPQAHAMTAETELLLFEASRAQLVRETIKPALDRGTLVLSDRFYDSTTVYQGVARRLDPDFISRLNAFAVGDCRPDITFVLDVDLGVARGRMNLSTRRADRMEQQPDEFYEAVRAGYHALAEREPARVVWIDGGESLEAIASAIWKTISSRFPDVAVRAGSVAPAAGGARS